MNLKSMVVGQTIVAQATSDLSKHDQAVLKRVKDELNHAFGEIEFSRQRMKGCDADLTAAINLLADVVKMRLKLWEVFPNTAQIHLPSSK